MLTFLSILFSGLLGVIVSSIMYINHDKHLRKLDVARKLFRHRFHILSAEFMEALNEVFVVFHKSDTVISELVKYHTYISGKQVLVEDANKRMLGLFKAISVEVKIKSNIVDDEFFLKPFNSPKAHE